MKKPTLIISSYDDLKNPYFAGGGARAVHEVAKRLTNEYSVIVLTGKYPGSKNEIIDGVTYERIGTGSLGGKLDQITFFLTLPWYVITKKFDVWMESFTPPFSTACLQLFTRKPVIGVVHMLSGEDMKRKYKLPFDVIEKIGLKTYKTIVVTSQFIGDKIRKENRKANIVVIPNGIESATTKPHTKGNYLLFLGRIEVNQKGLDLLLNAYADIAENIHYSLYIAGSGEKKEEEKLHALISSLKLEKKVTLVGNVQGEAKEKMYANALCVILPSRFETFSIVALESMAHAKAVIHFAIDGMRWIPDTCGITVVEMTKEALAKELAKAVKSPEVLSKLGENGQAFAKKFTWESVANDYKTLLKKYA